MRKLLTSFFISLLALLVPFASFAAVIEHDLSSNPLTITADNVNQDGYRVTQSTDVTSNTISVNEGVTAYIELAGVNIESDSSCIDIQGNSSVTLSLSGDSFLKDKGETAALHVAGGNLTITGDGSLTATDSDGDAAAIGSNSDENMTGSITIEGNASVTAESADEGTGIGSGERGVFSGSVTIRDNTKVTAISGENGAGIGSGEDADFTGSVVITDNAAVNAISRKKGSGIGSGEDGIMAGDIYIGRNSQVNAISGEDKNPIGGSDGSTGNVYIGIDTVINGIPGYKSDEIKKKIALDDGNIYSINDRRYYYRSYDEIIASMFYVNENGERSQSYETLIEDNILNVTSLADSGEFRANYFWLYIYGIKEAVFTTGDTVSVLDIRELFTSYPSSSCLVLSHTDGERKLLIGNTDASHLIKDADLV